MSPLILRLLNQAKRDAFTGAIDDQFFDHGFRFIGKPFTTPIKAFHIFRFVDNLTWENFN